MNVRTWAIHLDLSASFSVNERIEFVNKPGTSAGGSPLEPLLMVIIITVLISSRSSFPKLSLSAFISCRDLRRRSFSVFRLSSPGFISDCRMSLSPLCAPRGLSGSPWSQSGKFILGTIYLCRNETLDCRAEQWSRVNLNTNPFE